MKTLLKKTVFCDIWNIAIWRRNNESTISRGAYYQKKAFREMVHLNLNNHPVEKTLVKANVTFSFDFAQMVHYPNNSDQIGCLYLKVPRKCSLFMVANKALGTQVTYLIDEIVHRGKGSNVVIGYVHEFLNKHSFGVSNLSLQADNCLGQNKKNFFMFYLVGPMLGLWPIKYMTI